MHNLDINLFKAIKIFKTKVMHLMFLLLEEVWKIHSKCSLKSKKLSTLKPIKGLRVWKTLLQKLHPHSMFMKR